MPQAFIPARRGGNPVSRVCALREHAFAPGRAGPGPAVGSATACHVRSRDPSSGALHLSRLSCYEATDSCLAAAKLPPSSTPGRPVVCASWWQHQAVWTTRFRTRSGLPRRRCPLATHCPACTRRRADVSHRVDVLLLHSTCALVEGANAGGHMRGVFCRGARAKGKERPDKANTHCCTAGKLLTNDGGPEASWF